MYSKNDFFNIKAVFMISKYQYQIFWNFDDKALFLYDMN